jgi:hypothetical protein
MTETAVLAKKAPTASEAPLGNVMLQIRQAYERCDLDTKRRVVRRDKEVRAILEDALERAAFMPPESLRAEATAENGAPSNPADPSFAS